MSDRFESYSEATVASPRELPDLLFQVGTDRSLDAVAERMGLTRAFLDESIEAFRGRCTSDPLFVRDVHERIGERLATVTEMDLELCDLDDLAELPRSLLGELRLCAQDVDGSADWWRDVLRSRLLVKRSLGGASPSKPKPPERISAPGPLVATPVATELRAQTVALPVREARRRWPAIMAAALGLAATFVLYGLTPSGPDGGRRVKGGSDRSLGIDVLCAPDPRSAPERASKLGGRCADGSHLTVVLTASAGEDLDAAVVILDKALVSRSLLRAKLTGERPAVLPTAERLSSGDRLLVIALFSTSAIPDDVIRRATSDITARASAFDRIEALPLAHYPQRDSVWQQTFRVEAR